MPGTNFSSPLSSTSDAILVDENGLVVFGKFTGSTPSDAGVFSPGCILIKTDQTPGGSTLFSNVGTIDTPSFLQIP